MTVSSDDHPIKAWSVAASLSIALFLAPGCNQGEGPSPIDANPLARADLPRLAAPKPSAAEGKAYQETPEVTKDMKKDLGGPVLKPDATTSTPPPAQAPGAP